MASLLDAILGMSGQERTEALRQLGRDLEYYVPPELRGILGFAAEMTPTATLERAAQAGGEMLAPDRTAMERLGSAGQMLSETAGVAAPMMVAGRAAMPAAQAIPEGLLGFSVAADDVGRRVIDRLNQPGPVPTMYSNPVGRAADDAPTGILAYHGSPHDFDRFSMSKIGTGEGAQAYGHGLYFAEAEPVAKGYRDQISKGNTSAARRALEAADGDVDRAIQDVESKLRRLDERAALGDFGGDERRFAAQRQIQSDKIQQLKAFKETGEFNAGRMYEVNIKANPEDFLDWDKPLSEQPSILRRLGLSDRTEGEINAEAVRLMEEGNAKAGRPGGWMEDPEISARIDALNDEINNLAPSVSGESFYRSGGQGGAADLMSQLGSGSPQMRSQELLEAGIPGIKYFDAMSRGAGEGSRNYVVFDESLIDIVRKYGIAGAALMLGMSQADLAQAMQAQQQQPQGLLGGPQ